MTEPADYHPTDDRYSSMSYRRCGRSGILLPALSLGLWHNFGDDRPIDRQRAILRRAFDLGITHFDLANNYGPPYGSAEANFGRILRSDFRGYRDELVISTKAGWDMWPGPYGDLGSRKYLLASLDQSLQRLGLDYVDIFYHHRFDPNTPLEETLGALHSAVQQGKALYVGISSYSDKRTAEAIAILRKLGTPLLIHQPSYSMLNRWIEHGLLDVLGDEGVGCIAFSPLAQGVLTDRYLNGIPEGLTGSRELVAQRGHAERRHPGSRSGTHHHRGATRPEPRPDGARLGASRRRGSPRWSSAPRASTSSSRTSKPSTTSSSPRTSSRRLINMRSRAVSTCGEDRPRRSRRPPRQPRASEERLLLLDSPVPAPLLSGLVV